MSEASGAYPSCEPVTEVECTLIARGPEDLCDLHLAEFRAWQAATGRRRPARTATKPDEASS